MKLCVIAIFEAIACFSFLPTNAHSRWKCPEARSPSTGIKSGPCGDETNDFSNDLGLEIKPGPLRIIFEESIHHTGAPFRISLSDDGNDDSSCVLLDHIPHNDCCRPSLYDESTYTPYVITVNIPNVVCEKCSLHLSNPMTDKIREDGAPNSIGCTDPGTCFSVYHSCTRPFRIVGSVSEGAVPRSDYVCNSENANEGWPQVWTGDYGESVDASTPFLYRRESSVWSAEDFTLTTAPSWYREDAGGVCGEKIDPVPEIISLAENTTVQYTESSGEEGVEMTTAIATTEDNTAVEITEFSSEEVGDVATESATEEFEEQSNNSVGNSVDMFQPQSAAAKSRILPYLSFHAALLTLFMVMPR